MSEVFNLLPMLYSTEMSLREWRHCMTGKRITVRCWIAQRVKEK